MNIVKFIGRILALPIKIVKSLIMLGILPIAVLINWLNGHGKYNKMYLTFSKLVIKHTIKAIKRGEKPILENIIQYSDDYKLITFYNEKECPRIVNINRVTTDENGWEPDVEIIN